MQCFSCTERAPAARRFVPRCHVPHGNGPAHRRRRNAAQPDAGGHCAVECRRECVAVPPQAFSLRRPVLLTVAVWCAVRGSGHRYRGTFSCSTSPLLTSPAHCFPLLIVCAVELYHGAALCVFPPAVPACSRALLSMCPLFSESMSGIGGGSAAASARTRRGPLPAPLLCNPAVQASHPRSPFASSLSSPPLSLSSPPLPLPTHTHTQTNTNTNAISNTRAVPWRSTPVLHTRPLFPASSSPAQLRDLDTRRRALCWSPLSRSSRSTVGVMPRMAWSVSLLIYAIVQFIGSCWCSWLHPSACFSKSHHCYIRSQSVHHVIGSHAQLQHYYVPHTRGRSVAVLPSPSHLFPPYSSVRCDLHRGVRRGVRPGSHDAVLLHLPPLCLPGAETLLAPSRCALSGWPW
ncbi:hypothetical_protein [Leishmania braziliensis MHOM/BR/75/M2904]|uniref:Hypothetical_protein n=1 Tax=Leishmania braziliensis MHOM/BR/75/M2904 TaxID=420245 RepID=A0A3P3Z4C8_LEIBR|nr:hypothetical_protein [Leishmania braziliensis MHOM/BR/75/M2904]